MKKAILLQLIIMHLLVSMVTATDETFNVTIVISSPINISEDQGLSFGNIESSNSAQNVVVEPGDPGSAQFDITGNAVAATWSVVENKIDLVSGANSIMVNSFKVSGGGSGNLPQNDIRVGATAHLGKNLPSGTYTGTATFSVVYN